MYYFQSLLEINSGMLENTFISLLLDEINSVAEIILLGMYLLLRLVIYFEQVLEDYFCRPHTSIPVGQHTPCCVKERERENMILKFYL